MFELAVAVLELGRGDRNIASWLEIGAQRFLSHYTFRSTGKQTVAVCTPPEILQRAAAALEKYGFGGGRLLEYQLELAYRLPYRGSRVVEAVARSAFYPDVQPSEIFPGRDIRPLARSILASFGSQCKPFAEVAYEQISSSTAMGTGAAQVAAAAQHPQALPTIHMMMKEELAGIPAHKTIPWTKKRRLYELALAIAYSGEKGPTYTGPLHEIMQRKVQSWAPPFGMTELHPKRFCAVLKKIEGEDSVAQYAYCLDDKYPLDA